MRIEPEIDGISIVVVGNFNPAIFTPAWFALHELLPEEAAASASLQIAHPEITQFQSNWLNLQVTTDQFIAQTTQAPYIRVCDLAVRVFKEHLPHTPLRAFGINRDVHFCVDMRSEKDRIGRTLAPVEPWGTWGQQLGTSGEQGGMTSLTMTQVAIEGRPADDQINVTVGPSRIGEGILGVYVRVNDHHTAGETDGLKASGRLMEILEKNFDNSLANGEMIINHVMSLAKT